MPKRKKKAPARVPEVETAPVAGEVAVGDPLGSSAPAKRGPGAPRGNRNRETTGRHGRRLNELRLSHNRRLDAFERAAVEEAGAILREMDLEETATGRALGRQYARLEVVASRLLAILKSRGFRGADGRLKGEVPQLVEVVKALLDRLERLIKQASESRAHEARSTEDARVRIQDLARRWPGSLEFQVSFEDGTPLPDMGSAFALGPGARDPFVDEPSPLPIPEAPVAPAGEPTPTAAPATDHRAELARLDHERNAERLRRNWNAGLDPWGFDPDE